jgi:hypothetical protein
MPDDVARFQAKWQLGFLPPARVPLAATQLLEAGIEGGSLVMLAGLTGPSRAEVAPYVRRFLVECGAPPMSDDEARWLLVRAGVAAITAGTLTPREGAAQLAYLCRALGLPEQLRDFMYLSADYDPRDSWFDDRIRETAADVETSLRRSPKVAT